MTIARAALAGFILVVGFAVYGWAQVWPFPANPSGVVSGADIGFRVERTEGNKAIGRLMVRVNGKWLDAQGTSGVVPVQTQ